jgi:hypothetical protein
MWFVKKKEKAKMPEETFFSDKHLQNVTCDKDFMKLFVKSDKVNMIQKKSKFP